MSLRSLITHGTVAELTPDESARSAPTHATDPAAEAVPASPAQSMSSNVHRVLASAPGVMDRAPSLALGIARYGGPVEENAQQVAGVAKARGTEIGIGRLQGAVGPASFVLNEDLAHADPTLPVPKSAHTYGEGRGGGPAKNLAGAEPSGPGQFFSQVNSGLNRGLSDVIDLFKAKNNPESNNAGPNAMSLSTVDPGEAQLQSGIGTGLTKDINTLGQQINPNTVFTMPSHTFRYLYDVEQRHGPAAALKAAIPLFAGSALALAITHSPAESADAEAALARELGAGTETQAESAMTAAEQAAAAKNAGKSPAVQLYEHLVQTAKEDLANARKSGSANYEASAKKRLEDYQAELNKINEQIKGPPAAEPTEPVGSPKSTFTGRRAEQLTKNVLSPAVSLVRGGVKAGTALTSSPVTAGAELGTYASGYTLYPDSWNRTQNATTWKLPDGKIGPTFGRWVAGSAGLHPGAQAYNIVSGALDGFMQIAAPDPLGAAGRVYGKAHSAEGLGDSFLGKHVSGGTLPMTPESVRATAEQSWKFGPFNRTINALVKAQTPADVLALDQRWAPIAKRLAEANTRSEVIDVFEELARTQELLTTSRLPTMGPYAAAKRALREKLPNRLNPFIPAPMVFTDTMKRFSGKEFPIASDEAIPAIGNLLRSAGEHESVVQSLENILYGVHDPRIRIKIVMNATKAFFTREILSSFGSSGSTELREAVLKAMDEKITALYGGEVAGHTGEFGRSKIGKDLSLVRTDTQDPEERSYSAAIWLGQGQHFKMPMVRDMRREIRALAEMENHTIARGVYSRGSNFAAFIDNWVNERYFQPLALATAGWASRVSISEMTLNVLRQGPLNFTAAALASRAAKLGYKIDSKEMPHYLAAIRGIMMGVSESAVKALGKDRILDAALSATWSFNGHVVHPALTAVHSLHAQGTDLPETALQDIQGLMTRDGKFPIKKYKLSDSYSIFAPHNTGYFRSWSEMASLISHDELGSKMAAWYKGSLDGGLSHDEAAALTIDRATAYLDSLPESKLGAYTRHYASSEDGVAQGLDPHRDWADKAMQALQGVLFGQDGTTFHDALLNDMVEKNVPGVRGMMERYQKMRDEALPHSVPGRVLMPLAMGDVFQRISSQLHGHILGPIVNTLSREPTFIVDYANERRLLEDKVSSGELSQMQADAIAQDRAVRHSMRFVHNPVDRMKIENTLHVIAPFWFAQNQAIRRVGRLFVENPGAFEQYMKIMYSTNNFTTQIAQKNGIPTFIVPGSTLSFEGVQNALGWLNILPKGSIPIGLTGSADVSTTINPIAEGATGSMASAFRPNFGPVVAIPVKQIADWASMRSPKTASAANALLGPVASQQPFWLQLLPNSGLQHIAEGAFGRFFGHDLGSNYNTSLLSIMAAMAENGQLPTADQLVGNDPRAKADFIRRANNLTFVDWILRTVASYASPVPVALGQANLQFSTMAQNYINSANGDVQKGLAHMTRDHPDLIPAEVFKSTSAGGYSFPETEKAGEWVTTNRGLVRKYPTASVFLIPNYDEKGKFSEHTYLLQKAMNLRHEYTPAEFFDQIYIAAGDAYYFDVMRPAIEKAVAGDTTALQRQLTPELAQELVNNPSSYNVWTVADKQLQNYGVSTNPIWLDSWKSQKSMELRLQTISQMRTMLEDPSTPNTPQAQHLGDLVHLYYSFQGYKATQNLNSTQAKQQWDVIMNDRLKQYPDMKAAIRSVFLGAY